MDLDEVYRGYRIAIKLADGRWSAKIYQARGPATPLVAAASEHEGEAACLLRARQAVDQYCLYLGHGPVDD